MKKTIKWVIVVSAFLIGVTEIGVVEGAEGVQTLKCSTEVYKDAQLKESVILQKGTRYRVIKGDSDYNWVRVYKANVNYQDGQRVERAYINYSPCSRQK
jgi:hypothetical protein